jgi:hypothetical protein
MKHDQKYVPARPTRDEAKALNLPGWNIGCNRCGAYGARWLPKERPGWGALALCPPHEKELRAEQYKHKLALDELRAVRFEQED